MMYETSVNGPFAGEIVTYTVDENNNIVKIENPAIMASPTSVAVFVAGILVGYVFCVVVDGIIIAVTGESGAWWFAQAVLEAMNKPYEPNMSITIYCDVYPPHSYEGAMCRNTRG